MFSALAAPHAAFLGGAASASSASAPFTPQPATPWPDKAYRVAQRSAKHQAVLATAARLFCERGFHAAALDDVAARLQVSKPTLYYYVRSKKALIEACAQQGLENALQALQTASEGVGWGPRLQSCLRAYAQSVATDFGWCMVRSYELAQTADAVHQELARQLVAVCPEVRDTDEAVMWLLAVDGIACTGGRRAPDAAVFHVERLLSRLGHSVAAAVALPEPEPAPALPVEPVVDVPTVPAVPVDEAMAHALEKLEPTDALPAKQTIAPVAMSPGEFAAAAAHTLARAAIKPTAAPACAATAIPEPVKAAAPRTSPPAKQAKAKNASPSKSPVKAAQFSLF